MFCNATGMRTNWLRVAHRGASGSAPEHTREAFRRAVEFGADMIELDVQLSADGELVVIHDFELERTTSGHGTVRGCSLAALRELDAGSWFAPEFRGERILTLSEVLELVSDRADLNVEVKPTAGDEQLVAAELVQVLRRFDKVDSTIVSCFDFDVLRRLRGLDATLPLGLLTHDADFSATWSAARELKARSVHPHWALVTTELIADARKVGVEVITWTVNDVEVMEELLCRGVDGIISDYPERFRQVEARFD
jgi:glycerophosphoryl diester phosphodiesterase